MEHARNLNNEWYCHKLFWGLNPLFIFSLSITVIFIDKFNTDIFDYIFMFFELFFGIIAFVFMLMTRKKKQVAIPPRRVSLLAKVSDVQSQFSTEERPIKIYLDYKIKKNGDICFRVSTEIVDKEVKRKFNEFLDVENYLIEYVKNFVPSQIHEVPIIDKKNSDFDCGITVAAANKLK